MAEVKYCAICCGIYDSSEVVFSMHCGHIFHFHCMQNWQRRSISCPCCQTFDPKSHKIFFNYGCESEVQKIVTSLRAEKEAACNALKSELEVKNKTIKMLISRANEDRESFKHLKEAYEKAREMNYHYSVKLALSYKQLQHFNSTIANQSAKDLSKHNMEIKLLENRLKLKDDELRTLSATKVSMNENCQSMAVSVATLQKTMEGMKFKLLEIEKTNEQLNMKNAELEDIIRDLTDGDLATSTQVPQQNIETCGDDVTAFTEEEFDFHDIKYPENVVIIKHFFIELKSDRYKSAIIEMAKLMKLKIHDDDILMAKMIKQTNPRQFHSTKTVCVEFRDMDIKNAFIDCRSALKKYQETADLIIFGYKSIETQILLRFAISLRNYNYIVYCRNDKVMVAKPPQAAFRITSAKQVQHLMRGVEGPPRTNKKH